MRENHLQQLHHQQQQQQNHQQQLQQQREIEHRTSRLQMAYSQREDPNRLMQFSREQAAQPPPPSASRSHPEAR